MLNRAWRKLRGLFGAGNKDETIFVVPLIDCIDEHNRVYRAGAELIMPFIEVHGHPPKLVGTIAAQRDLREGIAFLRGVVRYRPENWNAYWIMGKGFQALKEHASAHEEFKRAYEIQGQHADVAREYVLECLQLGLAEDALEAAEHAVSLRPGDAGLLANLALAFLIAGQLEMAVENVEASLRLDPKDAISLQLKRVIHEVIQGRRLRPRKIGDIGKR